MRRRIRYRYISPPAISSLALGEATPRHYPGRSLGANWKPIARKRAFLRLTPHAFRHMLSTALSQRYRNTADIENGAAIMGHSRSERQRKPQSHSALWIRPSKPSALRTAPTRLAIYLDSSRQPEQPRESQAGLSLR